MYLHSNSTQILAYKKRQKREKKNSKKKEKNYLNFMQLFSADAIMKKIFFFKFFAHEKLKKTPKKVAQNRPRPLFPTVQPRHQPTAQN